MGRGSNDKHVARLPRHTFCNSLKPKAGLKSVPREGQGFMNPVHRSDEKANSVRSKLHKTDYLARERLVSAVFYALGILCLLLAGVVWWQLLRELP
jgi:hypothetical protein